MTSAISEYQFYEFRAVDRPLDDAAQEEIQRLSSRVEPTPRSAVFTYSFGDFRGDAIKVLMKHYDLMLYMANWGTWRIALRLPKSLIDQRVLRPYLVERLIMAKTMGTHLLLDINIYEDGGEAYRDWFEGDGQAGRIEPVRDELLRGDHRVLYLAWLAAVQIDPELEDATEPVEDLQSAHRKKQPWPSQHDAP